MEKFCVLLMIAAIVCALFADKIDTTVKGDKKVKKVIVVFSAGIIISWYNCYCCKYLSINTQL